MSHSCLGLSPPVDLPSASSINGGLQPYSIESHALWVDNPFFGLNQRLVSMLGAPCLC